MIAIALNGPGGSGKTTVAKQLERQCGIHHLSFDKWFESVPKDQVRVVWDSKIDEFFRELRNLLGSGKNVAVDAPFQYKAWPALLKQATEGHDLLVVELHCAFDTLVSRVEQREGSCDIHCRGHIQYMVDRIYNILPGHMSFDTDDGTDDIVHFVATHITAQQGAAPDAFGAGEL